MKLIVLLMVVSPIALLVAGAAASPRVRNMGRSLLQSSYGQSQVADEADHSASQHKRYDRGFVALLVFGVIGILLVLAIPIFYIYLLWWGFNYGGGHPH